MSDMSYTQVQGLRMNAAALMVVSVLIILGVIVSEKLLAFPPCVLCYYERLFWYVTFGLSACALLPRLPDRARFWLVAACVAALAGSIGLALYHVGVEHTWWAGTASCDAAAALPAIDSVDDLTAALSANPRPVAMCSEPAMIGAIGLSLAELNFLLSVGAFAGALSALIKYRPRF